MISLWPLGCEPCLAFIAVYVSAYPFGICHVIKIMFLAYKLTLAC